MICVNRMAAQGDVLFRRVDRLPGDAREQRSRGALVVAHSETGHHHVVEPHGVTLFTTHNPLVSYLRITGPFADVMHQRPFDTHETLRLLGAANESTHFEVRRQREYVPTPVPEPADDPRPISLPELDDVDLWRLVGD